MMNKMKWVAAVIMLSGSVVSADAQSTASATASATIVAPISISKNANMNFGNLAVNAVGGSVVLNPASDGRSVTGGVTLPATSGTVSAAKFTVTGNGTYTYAITLPSTVTLTHSGGVQTMNADAFTSTPSGTGQLTGGTQDIAVGATLHVAGGQLEGVYTSAKFDVTVNYN